MHDDENTAPIAVNEAIPPHVTVLTEITSGPLELFQQTVYASQASAEKAAIEVYVKEMRADDARYLDNEQRAAAKERWLNRLRSGRPAHLGLGQTMRMRTYMVRP